MLEQVAMQLREKTDELLKELLSSAGIEIKELDLQNMAEFKERLAREGYEITTWDDEGKSFFKLSQFGKDIMGLQTWTDFDFGSETNRAKFMHKWTPLG